MIQSVSLKKPHSMNCLFKFEAGTPDYVALPVGEGARLRFGYRLGANRGSRTPELTIMPCNDLGEIEACAFWVKLPTKAVLFLSWWATFIRLTWAPCSIVWALPCVRGTIARTVE